MTTATTIPRKFCLERFSSIPPRRVMRRSKKVWNTPVSYTAPSEWRPHHLSRGDKSELQVLWPQPMPMEKNALYKFNMLYSTYHVLKCCVWSQYTAGIGSNVWRLCKSIRIVMCRHCSKQIGLLHWWQITILADQFKGKKSRKVALKTVFMHATVIGLVFFHFLDLTHNFSYFQFKSH